MKIKITHTHGDYQAGLVYELSDKQAKEMIAKDYGFEVVEKKATATESPVLTEKKVKNANR